MSRESMPLLISGIQHFSPCPGHGLRTTVFFTGCPLRCYWCCNPECRRNRPVLVCNTEKCIGPAVCRHCVGACPHDAIYVSKNAIRVARDRCTDCGECVSRCPSGALFMSGRAMSLEEIMEDILKDKDYIMNGGGITLSGGEPMMHPQQAADLMRLAHEEGLHTAMETCGFFDLDAPHTIAALRETDLLFFDIKHSDPLAHRRGTGVDNSRILCNFQRIVEEFPGLEINSRTLVVPGFNDDTVTMRNIARIVKKTGFFFHILETCSTLCGDKYAQMGLPFGYDRLSLPQDRLEAIADVFQEEGLSVEIR